MSNLIKKTSGANKTQILFATEPQVGVSIQVSDTGITAVNGKKIVKAGTPLKGDLTARATAMVKADTEVVGVLLHDVDVTAGAANGSLLIHGFVNLDRLDSTTAALITENVKTALKGNVTFLK